MKEGVNFNEFLRRVGFEEERIEELNDKFDYVLYRFMRRDIDGVSQREAEMLRTIHGAHEEDFRSIRDMYIFASGLMDHEYIKYLKWTLNEIKKLKEYNKEAWKEALDWFNIRVAPYNKQRVSWW